MSLLDSKSWSGRIFLDGWRAGSGGERAVVEPATGGELGVVGMASPADVRVAAARAADAQREWASGSFEARAEVLRRAGDLWHQHAEEIHGWIVRESGAIPPFGPRQTHFASTSCHEAAGLAALPHGEILRTTQPHLSFTRRVPVGVVGVISPFNAPLVLAIRAVAPALALGNAVVLKPDPRTAVCGGVSLARIFEEAGLPAGLLSVLPGGADVGEALVADPGVHLVSFTGSTRAGRIVARMAAERSKRVHLELGGNSALIVLDDVDVEKAVSVGSFGSFMHQGQICMTTGRHLVQRSIAEQYVEGLRVHADRLPVGNPATDKVALGPIIDATQRDRIHGLVRGSVDAGARLVAGGTYEGLFYRPTVLADVPRESPAFREEIFGPVAPVVAFDTLEEAALLARDTDYGLSLGILSRDVSKAMALADRIPSGIVHINDQTVADEVVNPFGGVRASGGGARLGGPLANFESFTEVQWVTLRSDLPDYPF
ncbi:MAG TPA: aldehyde dehydrogenase family protein [Kofleriaceae bacterium]|nr:aldehyde dehydrogenase family protein [Kofleriaceae bacterium]